MINNIIAAAACPAASSVFLATSEEEARWVYEAVKFWQEKTFLLLRPSDKLYSSTQPPIDRAWSFCASLSQIAGYQEAKIVVTTPETIFLKLPPQQSLLHRLIHLKAASDVCIEKLSSRLIEAGFHKSHLVQAAGQFARRGEIVDIGLNKEENYRIYFNYGTIEKIKLLDICSQRSSQEIPELKIHPIQEVVLSDENLTIFRERFKKSIDFPDDKSNYHLLLSRKSTKIIHNLWPYFFRSTESILDFVPDASIIYTKNLLNDFKTFIANSQNQISEAGKLTSLYSELSDLIISEETVEELSKRTTTLSNWSGDADNGASLKIPQGSNQELEDFISDLLRKGKSVVISTGNNLDAIKAIIDDWGAPCHIVTRASDLVSSKINLCEIEFPSFVLGETVVIHFSHFDLDSTPEQTTGKAKKHVKNYSLKHYLFELNNFEPGEIVVHRDYGIGRFLGLESVTVSNITKDYVKLLYAKDDKLFVPVESIDLIKKFGDGEYKLDSLDRLSWQRRKSRLKERITELAYALVHSAACRSLKKIEKVTVDSVFYEKFLKTFPHVDTTDQAAAVQDIIEDLAEGRILDRLICGDVGYGKTEVAIRAAFLLLQHDPSSQIVLITPTTVLTRQHFVGFKQRFEPFGFKVAQLSRLLPPNEQKLTKNRIAEGEANLIISTVGAINHSTEFKNLKLIIIDEEHQFGVKQKEAIKKIKTDCHMLYLSATPIPRTLHMSLIGLKDMTIMNTPPFEKRPINTIITEKGDQVLKEAVEYELHRKGQVLYVVPRKQFIEGCLENLKGLLPKVRVAVAHGELPAIQLDTVLQEFYDGKHDVLLATNIIGSGLDIPSANTIIVDNAELFGLAQLYQLRGRVGRGKQQGYSYFFSSQVNQETKAAQRLQIIQSNQDLGSGFNIASYDMDIRGFGNLLGSEQSGVIKEVGIELYQDMVREEINRIKLQDAASEEIETKINLHSSVSIPYDYIQDSDVRLLIYRKIASLASEQECDSLFEELEDRFGVVPAEVKKLAEIVELKIACKEAKVLSVDTGPLGAVLKFQPAKHAILEKMAASSPNIKFRSDNSIFVRAIESALGNGKQINYITSVIKKLNQIFTNAESHS